MTVAPRVLIRVDGASHIGIGHTKRCLSLAIALRHLGSQVRFVSRNLGLDVSTQVRDQGFECDVLPIPAAWARDEDASDGYEAWAGVHWGRDAEETVKAAVGWMPDWIVVDHYAFGAQWHAEVRKLAGARIAVIDDLANRALEADLIVDPNLDADSEGRYGSLNKVDGKFLGGPRFAMLAPAYSRAPRYIFSEDVGSIGIFMGGTDPDNCSALAVEAVRKSGFRGGLDVASTSANPNLASLETACSRFGARLSLDLPHLAHFFAAHDLQIGAGGSATWERCCIGVPTVAIATAENQRELLRHIVSGGGAFGVSAPDLEGLTSRLREIIADVAARRSVAQAASHLVDGMGARRVAAWIAKDHIAIRAARAQDVEITHSWRNHPSIRAVSRNQDEISLADHTAWFQTVLTDRARNILIAEIGPTPIGTVRFDELEEHCLFEISIHLEPGLSGLGLGPRVLLAAEAWLHRKLGDVSIHAVVLPGNTASERLFVRAGYEKARGGYRKRITRSS